MNIEKVAQIFQECRNSFKIQGARTENWSKSDTEDLQIFGTKIKKKNSVTTTTRFPVFTRPWSWVNYTKLTSFASVWNGRTLCSNTFANIQSFRAVLLQLGIKRMFMYHFRVYCHVPKTLLLGGDNSVGVHRKNISYKTYNQLTSM